MFLRVREMLGRRRVRT